MDTDRPNTTPRQRRSVRVTYDHLHGKQKTREKSDNACMSMKSPSVLSYTQTYSNTSIQEIRPNSEFRRRYQLLLDGLKTSLHGWTKLADSVPYRDATKFLRDIARDIAEQQKKADELLASAGLPQETSHVIPIRPITAPAGKIEVKNALDFYKRRCSSFEDEIAELKLSLEEKQSKSELFAMERNEALSRLSEITGHRLRDNNPNVADLSVKFRPIKIAEMYRELYDNQWTDAYLLYIDQNISQQNAIKKLLDILFEAYSFCRKQCQRIYTNLTATGTFIETTDTPNEPLVLPKECLNLAKEFRKSTATALLPVIQRDFLSSCNLGRKSKHLHRDIEAYCRQCVEITWYMSVQTPQMVLTEVPKHGSKIDLGLYAYYTLSGSCLDYVVWPACRFENGGDMLSKGVAQAMKGS